MSVGATLSYGVRQRQIRRGGEDAHFGRSIIATNLDLITVDEN